MRWQDIPFYLRTGKRLAQRISEISIRFHAVPHLAFPAEAPLEWQLDRLVICIEPEEGIVLKFLANQPGPIIRLRPANMRASVMGRSSKQPRPMPMKLCSGTS